MITIAIEASQRIKSIAIANNDNIIYTNEDDKTLELSKNLIPFIDDSLTKSNLKINDIDLFVTTLGPGSFTSLRVMHATIKGLTFEKNKPIVAISSLKALSLAFKDYINKNIFVIFDALRNNVFRGLFRFENQNLLDLKEDQLISIDNLYEEIKDINNNFIICGNGIKLLKPELKKYIIDNPLEPKAKDFLLYGIELFKKGQSIYNSQTLLPKYLQGFGNIDLKD